MLLCSSKHVGQANVESDQKEWQEGEVQRGSYPCNYHQLPWASVESGGNIKEEPTENARCKKTKTENW